jgi:hypothetical protein
MSNLKTLSLAVIITAVSFIVSSCAYNSRGISDSNARLMLEKNDVSISQTLSASASETLILGIDWKRLFKREVGEVRRSGAMALPVIGSTPTSRAEGYATYTLLKDNADYDAALYPQYEGVSKGFFPFFWKTDVTVKSKLVRVNP